MSTVLSQAAIPPVPLLMFLERTNNSYHKMLSLLWRVIQATVAAAKSQTDIAAFLIECYQNRIKNNSGFR